MCVSFSDTHKRPQEIAIFYVLTKILKRRIYFVKVNDFEKRYKLDMEREPRRKCSSVRISKIFHNMDVPHMKQKRTTIKDHIKSPRR